MLEALEVFHIKRREDKSEEQWQKELSAFREEDFFSLVTCQRAIFASFGLRSGIPHTVQRYQGIVAYRFLLEVICGLHSLLPGEHEITGQFKQAYQQYLQCPGRSSMLLEILQKLSKDAKEIRTHYLAKISQLSYSAIARKLVRQHHKGGNVLVLGSGALCQEILGQYIKHFPMIVCARNQQRVDELLGKFGADQFKTTSYFPSEMGHHLVEFNTIINTIPDRNLFPESLYKEWCFRSDTLFIDLTSMPGVLPSSVSSQQNAFRLSDIFDLGAQLDRDKENQLQEARKAILRICEKRPASFHYNLTLGWDDLMFA